MKTEESLLFKASAIGNKFRLIEQKTGARFNVYSIARIERKEEVVHSRMISELLNPNGSHGQGVAFLNLFFEIVGEANECVMAGDKVIVEDERRISHDEQNGRIDIYIETRQLVVVIENKVDAIDQPRQVERYWNYAKSRNKRVVVFYLTPDGRCPSQMSLGDIKKSPAENKDKSVVTYQKDGECVDLRLMSYRNEIASWLESCLYYCITTGLPNVTEGLNQYLRLVKKISGVNMSGDEVNEMHALLQTTEHVLSARRISSVFSSSSFRGKLLYSFMAKLRDGLKSMGFSDHSPYDVGLKPYPYAQLI